MRVSNGIRYLRNGQIRKGNLLKYRFSSILAMALPPPSMGWKYRETCGSLFNSLDIRLITEIEALPSPCHCRA